jgi:hypothetical protein
MKKEKLLRRYIMKKLIIGIMAASFCLGSTTILAATTKPVKSDKIMYLQEPNGTNVKVRVPSSEVHKLHGLKKGAQLHLLQSCKKC